MSVLAAVLAVTAPATAEPTFAMAWFGRDGRLLVSVSPDGRGWAPPVRHGSLIRSANGPALLFSSQYGWRVFWLTPDGARIGMSRGFGNARRGVKFGPPRFVEVPAEHRPFQAPPVRPAAVFDGRRWVIAYSNRTPGRITVGRSGTRRGGGWTFETIEASRGWMTPPAIAHGNGAFLLAYAVPAPGGAELRMRRSPDGSRWSKPFKPRISGRTAEALSLAPVQGPVLAFAGGRFLLAVTNRRDKAAPRFLYRYDLSSSANGQEWSPLAGGFVAWSTTRAAVAMAVRPTGGCTLVAVSSSRPSGGLSARNIHIRHGVTRTDGCQRARTIRWAPLNAPFSVRSMLDRFVAVAYGNPHRR